MPIIFVTHDQKEDWWNIVKGKTIGPRVELRKEFASVTNQEFHMYSMNGFIQVYNELSQSKIDNKAVKEIQRLDMLNKVLQNSLRREKERQRLFHQINIKEDELSEIRANLLMHEKSIAVLENELLLEGTQISQDSLYNLKSL